MKTIEGNIHIPIFECSIELIACDNLKSLEKFYSVKVPENIGAFVHRISNRDYLMAFDNKSLSESMGLLSHECVHIANFVSEDCGIKTDSDNDEFTAHLVGFVFDKAKNILDEKQ